MKVCVVLYKFGEPSDLGSELGSYQYFYRQLAEWQRAGLELVVVAPWQNWLRPGPATVDGLRVRRYWPKLATRSLRNLLLYKLVNKLYIWRTGRLVQKVVSRENCDIVYVRQARETGYAIARTKKNLSMPVVFQPITTWRWHFEEKLSGSPFDWLRVTLTSDLGNQKKYAQEILKTFDHLITYNKPMIEEYVALGAAREKFQVIPGAVDHEVFKPVDNKQALRQRFNLPLDKKLILYIGRLNFKEKGLDDLLDVFRDISKSLSGHLLIIGPGTAEQRVELGQMIEKLNLEDRVSYLGKKKYNDLPDYINACDVGVVPSVWFESSGRVSLDMLSCGLPVIVTAVGGLSEYSVDQKTGFVVEPQNSDGLKYALERILIDDRLRLFMGQYARQHVLNNYTFERITKLFIDFFNAVKEDSS